jgi:DNA-binding transcriptional MerR regulator
MSSTAPATVPEHKEPGLCRIGDVSRIADVKPFVLRYWEGEFPMLQPVKSESGHRLYRQEDVDLVLKIRRLLYDEGFTIAGARRHLRDAMGEVTEAESEEPRRFSDAERSIELLSRGTLLDLRDALRSLLTLLEGK